MRQTRVLAAVLLLSVGLAHAEVPPPPAEWLIEQVRTLSAPEMEGRASGTRGAERAATAIAKAWRDAGVVTELQPFEVPTGIRLGPVNALEILSPTRRALKLGRDFTPLSVSSDGTV